MAIRNFEQLTKLKLSSFAACVIYIHHKTISQPALEAFEQFVSNGGGVLAIHSATASFKQTPRFFEILGGRFTEHAPITTLHIEPQSTPNEPFDGLPAFTVRDEPYLHEFQQNIRVHFTSQFAGQPQPMVWTYHYGTGKVCCAVPGHLLETMRNKTYQEVLKRGLAWVST